ncbi:MAG: undecaprenyl-diphosphate phosphatase [Acidimicrobiia bacterium]
MVGSLVAAVSGYLAIGALLRLLARTGLAPFAVYCLIFGAVAYVLL